MQGVPNTMDPRLLTRHAVSADAVDESFRLLNAVLSNRNPKALFLVELYLRSCKAFEDHNYALSLVTAWAVVENLLQRLWIHHIGEQKQKTVEGTDVFINSDRMSKLADGRDFTASVISEFLSFADVLPFKVYQNLSYVRRARNDWMHELKPVTRLNAIEAVQLTHQMLNLVDELDLNIPIGSRLNY
jgi:hypothetical protein